jgi:hypothetical protein
LENHIKNEIIEKSQIVCAQLNSEANTEIISEPRRSASIACGANIFEVSMKLPQWALQVLISVLITLLIAILSVLVLFY